MPCRYGSGTEGMNGAPSEPTRPPFPPPELRLGEAFPPDLGPRNGGALLAIWDFANRFGDVLGLWPCTLDELLSAGERLSMVRCLCQQPPPGLMPVMACTLALCQHAQAAVCWWSAGTTAHVALCCCTQTLPSQCEGAMGLHPGRFLASGVLSQAGQLCVAAATFQAEGNVQGCQQSQRCLLFSQLEQSRCLGLQKSLGAGAATTCPAASGATMRNAACCFRGSAVDFSNAWI